MQVNRQESWVDNAEGHTPEWRVSVLDELRHWGQANHLEFARIRMTPH